ncbi:MAG: (2Fe-2S)-binding protein [Bradyrhizobium sp.]
MSSRACSRQVFSATISAGRCCRANRWDGLATAGPIVCACFGVGRTTICDAIAAGAGSAAEIGTRLKAGTNCGSCIPELKRLIAQADVKSVDGERQLVAVAS